jgi:hypothetical protein
VLAALVPSGFALFACLLFGLAASGHGSFLYAIAEMGTSFYFVLLASLAAIVGVSVLLYFAARGVSVPAALTVALASLPWLTGVAGARWGVHIAASAVAAADPSTRATILAVGVAEATQARLFGSLIASGLLAAVAFGLALGAIGQRAQGRSFAGGAIGLVAAFPLLALAGYATLAARLGGLGLLLAASGAMLATALAATGAGADSTRGRSGALASAAPIAAGLAVQAAAVAASSISLIEVFSAIANVDPASRVQLVAAGAREMAPLSWALVLCVPLSLVAAAAVAVWSATRARPTPTSLVGAGALLLTIGVIVSADGLAMGGASEDLREMGAPPWARVVGVDPVAIDRSDGSLEVQGIVTPEGLHRRDGSLAASFDPSALDRAVAELHAEALRSPDLMWEPPPGEDEQDPLRSRAELGLVLDARLGVDGLRALFAAASRAQIPAVDLVGPGAGAPTDAEREAVESVYPLLAPFLDSRGSVGVVLAGPTLAARAEEDAQLFHATVGAVPPTVAEVRADAEVPAEERALSPRGDRYRAIDRFGDERGPIYLALGEGVTTSSLVDTLERAAASGFVPVIAIGAIPGHPERPAPQILEGAEVGGALSREAIRAVVRRHLPEIRDCYERALVAAPELEGRVTVSFVISTTGAVDRATVGSTTLNDATVESCITSAVARWRFPAPDGGGLVTVNYPFVLQSE